MCFINNNEVIHMFKIGDFVINATNGICEITDVVTMNISGTDKEYFLFILRSQATSVVNIKIDARLLF